MQNLLKLVRHEVCSFPSAFMSTFRLPGVAYYSTCQVHVLTLYLWQWEITKVHFFCTFLLIKLAAHSHSLVISSAHAATTLSVFFPVVLSWEPCLLSRGYHSNIKLLGVPLEGHDLLGPMWDALAPGKMLRWSSAQSTVCPVGEK